MTSHFCTTCRKLLGDPQPGIRLRAAIPLAQSGIMCDPHEPRLFPILISAWESKEERKPVLDVTDYRYNCLPPGTPPMGAPSPLWLLYPGAGDPDKGLRDETARGLHRIRRYLPPDQQARLDAAL